MIPRQIMRVCRECPENNLPDCGKGKCERRDAVLKQQKACRDALAKDKAGRAAYMNVVFKSSCKKAGPL